jgi:hypothetical protein
MAITALVTIRYTSMLVLERATHLPWTRAVR